MIKTNRRNSEPMYGDDCWGPQKSPAQVIVDNAGIRAASAIGVGMNRLFGSCARDGFGILMYHRIAPETRGVPRPTINVTPSQFRKQISGLIDREFVFWPLRRVLALAARGEAIPPFVTVVTFDDGFETVYEHAWPVLKEFKIPATIFVPTAYIDSEEPFPFDHWGVKYRDRVPASSFRPLKTWQYEVMRSSGLIEIGAHTHTHQDFRGRPNDFRDDLQTSINALKSRFGETHVPFAFPYGTPRLGFTDGETVQAARATGVSCGLTTASDLVVQPDDPFQWGRFNAFHWDTGATLAAKLHGWYSWAPRRSQRLRARMSRVFRLCADPLDAEAIPVETSLPNSAAASDSHASAANRSGIIEPNLRTDLPKISVIVPTFNRAEWLREAVQSLQSQVTDGLFTYEIVIIDNASTDATSQVASELAARSDVPIKYFYQPTPGDAPTRNMGIRNSQGQWLAFFDDDQFADATWLQELYRVASSTESSIVGGPVHLNLPEEQLDYLGPLCRKALREISYYPTVHPYLKRHLPGTGNALVSRSVFEDVGLFDETMTSGGSDHDFFLRARAAHYALWYAPHAIIRHRIPAQRLTKAYFRWDALTGGAGHAAHLDYKRKGLAWTVLMCVARLGHSGLVTLPKLVAAWSRGDDGHVLGRQTVLWRAEGYARKTLALIAPRLFAQRRFFESLEFRNGRTIGQKTEAPTKEMPQSIGADA